MELLAKYERADFAANPRFPSRYNISVYDMDKNLQN